MTDKKPGIIRRIFSFIGKIITGVRAIVGLLVFVFIVSIIAGMFGGDLQPIPERGALYLAPSGVLVDQKTYVDPLEQLLSQSGGRDSQTLVREVVEAIDSAAGDSRITHLVLDTDYMAGAGLSKLEEISSALLRFKKSEKPIIALGDNFNQPQYYLAAHADEIILNPMGMVTLTGFSYFGSYYKDALDKLKINVHIFRAGEFKSAVEPYMGNAMSPGVKQERQTLINSLWSSYRQKVESVRGLPEGAVDSFIGNLIPNLQQAQGDSAQLALNEGLVDMIAGRTQTLDYLNEVIPGSDGKFDYINLRGYLNNIRLAKLQGGVAKKHKVAVVVAKGSILDGEQPEGNVGGDTLASMLANVRDDENVKALVLRVDSPGGSAFASEIIRDALSAIRDQAIPVVISMGSVAASGGYWISTDADHVMALPTTITGSIGVYGIVPTVEESMAALGIYSDGVGTSGISGLMQLDRAMSPQAEAFFQSGVDGTYNRFLKLVANARDMTTDQVHELAQGRVWTGQQALQLGLIDELGDLKQAIEAAANLAGLDEYAVDYRRKPLNVYEQFLSEMNSNVSASLAGLGIDRQSSSWLRRQAKAILEPFRMLDTLNDPRGIYLHCEQCPR
jgi:protease IV